MKVQKRTKRISRFTTVCMFIASSTLTVIGFKMENTGLLITGIIAWLVSFITGIVTIFRLVSETLFLKKTIPDFIY